MDENVYSPPEAELKNYQDGDIALATRWQRLWASLIYNILIGIFGFTVFFLLNGKFLITNGQTIGKKLLAIKIVDLNGSVPSKQHIAARYAVYFLPGQVPIIGQLFSVLNVLFIFGKSKRCLHDHVAKTNVVIV